MSADRSVRGIRPSRCAGIAAAAGCVLAAMAPASTGVAAQAYPTTANSISRADKAEGAKAHPDLLPEFGGALTGPQASYVEQVGKTIAIQSGLSNARGDFTVTLLNSPVNNAFAIPGGYVYVTRQLTALMNNEAELAGVLGHEVGHVAARHSAKRQQAASRNQLLGVLGSVLSGVLLGDSAFGRLGQQLASQGSQMLTLKYSRSQELEADRLGISYLKRAGYDPRAMATVLDSLARQNALESQLRGSTNQVPQWASTHPDPASRVRDAQAQAGSAQSGSGQAGMTNRDVFLARIDGLVYGDDPKQGIIDGNRFTHPDLRLAFQAPEGFYLVNGTQAVSINGDSGKAQFSGGALGTGLDAYIQTVFASLTQSGQARIVPSRIERAEVNGLAAAYGVAQVQASSGPVDVAVFAYDFGGGKAYHFLTITRVGGAGAFNGMFKSMRRITAGEAGQVKPRRLSVVTVKAGDTVQSLAGRMAYTDAAVERFLVLNGLESSARLVPGQKVKLVVY
ncbi:MAG: peptidase Ste24p [Novosphingobium lindaniclasticum]|jgi:predicted Zn-dependent protease|nr:peptidase Ste24p [Novosphingobium lindaniclasticum]